MPSPTYWYTNNPQGVNNIDNPQGVNNTDVCTNILIYTIQNSNIIRFVKDFTLNLLLQKNLCLQSPL